MLKNLKKEIFKVKTVTYMVTVFVLALTTNTSWAQKKPNIKELTSGEKTKEVAGDIPTGGDTGIKLHSLGLGIGQTFIMGDAADNGEDKITWDVYYNYSASYSFDFMTNFHTSKHKYQGKYIETTGLALSIKAKAFQFDSFAPFALGGLGFYWPKMRREVAGSLQDSKTKTTFGLNLGAGAELRLNRHFMVGVIGHYHNPFDVKQDNGLDVELSYFKLLVTLFYTF